MSDDVQPVRDRRLSILLADLAETAPAAVRLSPIVVRRARRQRALRSLVHLLVVVVRTVPDAIALGTRKRR